MDEQFFACLLWIHRCRGDFQYTDQIDGLRAVPMNRMLLETDSPYMKPGGGYINAPAFIGDVATVVASK